MQLKTYKQIYLQRRPTNKSTISGDISTRILRQHAQIYSKKLADMFNESIKMGKYPDIPRKLKLSQFIKRESSSPVVQ